MITRGRKTVFTVTLAVLAACLLLSLVYAVKLGTLEIPTEQITKVLAYKLFGAGDKAQYGEGAVSDIVWFIRLPRLVLAVFTGIALSVCGAVMQAIVKNPLADPYILGVSSGASLGATLAILLGLGSGLGGNFVGIMACFGAFAVGLLVLGIAHIGGRANTIKLLLAGMALSAVCSSVSSLVVYLTNDRQGMANITFWLMGSLAGAKWESLAIIAPTITLCFVFFLTQTRTLNLMLLGDDTAITLGTDLRHYRNVYLFISALMVGCTVYAAGMIGFVGLLIPHIARMIFGTNHRYVLPISVALGAILLVWADVLCRVILPNTELPIGILISAIGAPFFVFLLLRNEYGFGGAS